MSIFQLEIKHKKKYSSKMFGFNFSFKYKKLTTSLKKCYNIKIQQHNIYCYKLIFSLYTL